MAHQDWTSEPLLVSARCRGGGDGLPSRLAQRRPLGARGARARRDGERDVCAAAPRRRRRAGRRGWRRRPPPPRHRPSPDARRGVVVVARCAARGTVPTVRPDPRRPPRGRGRRATATPRGRTPRDRVADEQATLRLLARSARARGACSARGPDQGPIARGGHTDSAPSRPLPLARSATRASSHKAGQRIPPTTMTTTTTTTTRGVGNAQR